jgi:GT2 family glycosyltransferase
MSSHNDPILISVVIVSFNTRDLLRECLTNLFAQLNGITNEVFVVDNASSDHSADMVEREFPQVKLIRSKTNLGFAGANNCAFQQAKGRYVVLLNSDAFPLPGALKYAMAHMETQPSVGLGGAKLIGRDGAWQPSARQFPSLLNDFLILSGLSTRYPDSRFFGRPDRTWVKQEEPASVEWVPGAFSIIRRDILTKVGFFDEQFFLYYEEVDLCRRIKQAGYLVYYWPDVVVVHQGGESSKTVKTLAFSSSGSQLVLWRMRSAFLYYRKHHGFRAWLAKNGECCWHAIRLWKNRLQASTRAKATDSEVHLRLLQQAWLDTRGGRVSPPPPW